MWHQVSDVPSHDMDKKYQKVRISLEVISDFPSISGYRSIFKPSFEFLSFE
jgi:hypothetical protein